MYTSSYDVIFRGLEIGVVGNTAFALLTHSEEQDACNTRRLRETKLWGDSFLNKSLDDNNKSLI